MALAALVAAWTGRAALSAAVHGMPATLQAGLDSTWDAALPTFVTAPSAYLVGRGPALPVAAEAALKMKETAALHAEAFSGAEVMHGPLQLLQPGFPVMAFRQRDASHDAMTDSVARLRAAKGRVFDIATGPTPGHDADHLAAPATGYPLLDPLAMLLPFYAFAEKLARARGHDPDRPTLLRKVTETI